MEIEGFVLVGGASSRMGRDKSGLEYERKTFGNKRRACCCLTSRVTAVAARWQGFRIFMTDSWRKHARAGRLCTDFVRLEALRGGMGCRARVRSPVHPDRAISPARCRCCRRTDARCRVVPRQHDGRLQPLAAIYRREPSLRTVERVHSGWRDAAQGPLTRIETRSLEPEGTRRARRPIIYERQHTR